MWSTRNWIRCRVVEAEFAVEVDVVVVLKGSGRPQMKQQYDGEDSSESRDGEGGRGEEEGEAEEGVSLRSTTSGIGD